MRQAAVTLVSLVVLLVAVSTAAADPLSKPAYTLQCGNNTYSVSHRTTRLPAPNKQHQPIHRCHWQRSDDVTDVLHGHGSRRWRGLLRTLSDYAAH
jgi:hypothetical protein